ncbi:MAG: glycogen debranching enzyme family protein [Cyanobacteria bacterium Co-bin8]|nr:glycogen debranching enzyme family protein [Cyanobacteria bacterium Co-bin8]
MALHFGRNICGDLEVSGQREWLVTNGIGGYASGTVAGVLTRHYHGLLVAALKPPLMRTLLVTKLDEAVHYGEHQFELQTDRWVGGAVTGHGYTQAERFHLEGTVPVWTYAFGDALLEKRIWMEQGANTTYVDYKLRRASEPLTLSLKALVNCRPHHDSTEGGRWQMQVESVEQGVQVRAFDQATPFYLLAKNGTVELAHTWCRGYSLEIEHARGIHPFDDHLHAATFAIALAPEESYTLVLSTEGEPCLEGQTALKARYAYEEDLLQRWQGAQHLSEKSTPQWLDHLVLAADQFVVQRPLPGEDHGKTVIAGYPWFGDWGRDTMISLPGLAIATGRPEIARPILRTFARYVDQGMLPNLFPEVGEEPHYNTIDATLWYFEATRAYFAATQDEALLRELFPVLEEIIAWHQKGTRYNIHMDEDGLIWGGDPSVQLTWMDAKVDDWVVTPRIGKPVEINALWYNALVSMAEFSRHLGQSADRYTDLAERVRSGFQRFWHEEKGYCYDVIDSPNPQEEDMLRPNQIFAVALPQVEGVEPLLSPEQQRSVVDHVARALVTSHGLRSLSPDHPEYIGQYTGGRYQRDGAYHQGTVWGWLIGPFVQAHLKVYRNPATAQSFLEPMADHLYSGAVGSLSEVFDGDAPFSPRGCFAQAWTVAEVLRTWLLTLQTT